MGTFGITGYGPTGGDQCCARYITVEPNVTVEDVIRDIISDKREWGEITVALTDTTNREEFKIEYKYGEIKEMKEYDRGIWHILQKFIVKSMSGYGGWSYNHYTLEVSL